MQQETTDTQEYQLAMESFLKGGGTIAMLNEISSDTLEQLYSLAFNQYQSGKYEDAHKVFQALCVLDHYDSRFFLGLGACRQAMGQYDLAIHSYSYGTVMDIKEPRFPFHAAECLLQKGELAEAESGLFLAQELIANKPEFKELSTRVSSMLEAIKLKKEMEHECVDNP
ncbi:TPA: type III secretion system chaperone SycD/LcrH [Yersinia enterocolitica]|uniref:type III secretion system chaperone SycD/LcrH n=1 Tax=Yersinia enterocolitica TaxID=630 RepID=UPI0005DB809C|nr:type III secretion system chaperone SycD/LcrH [Yersinia enterocolitica]AOF21279.1 CesD/SycD/LcrH family type III secretion system chaperone [Yersinia enterocolitica]AOF24946.1 CesD/SycD/LcrH family type III secretion system chaperone [Yersinia enterocolitica]AOF25549.1 CesD/SycD/LcrH family type III secretion system chaperone [Yersinia enterocolitica]AOF29657.1 CesD/SycD/LcrH family type III secretion system chaperone [Yersinia enterocolitica]AOF37581.1 CesD/SycD/LcrH family type III secret